MHLCLIYLYTIFQHFIRYINIICSTMFDIFKSFYHICNIAKLLYITFPQLPSAPLQFAVCCRRIPSNKDSLHPVGCRSTDNKNTPLHVNMQGASLLSDICSADAVFIKLYSARYHSNSSLQSCYVVFFVGFYGRNLGVLSVLYLLRGFSRDCIVILLSRTSKSIIFPLILYQ